MAGWFRRRVRWILKICTHKKLAGGFELPRDLLKLILEKLDLVDHARFAAVCSSWRSVAVENPPINKPLYFALSHDPENLVRRFITSFVPSWRTARFIGAGLDGWLVIAIDGRKLFLLNKGFNLIIPLPITSDPDHCKAVLSSPPSSSSSSSSVGCTVVIMHFFGEVFYCRMGSDKSFTKLPNCPDISEDILFYKEQLYVLCSPNTIVIFDHLLNKVSQLLVTQLAINPAVRRFLISRNNILSIVAGWPSRYSVFTLEGSEPRLVRVNNISEDDNFQILLSNCNCSLSIAAKDHKEFRRSNNCFEGELSVNFVLDTSKDPNKAKADDPWPLFFVMFSRRRIQNLVK